MIAAKDRRGVLVPGAPTLLLVFMVGGVGCESPQQKEDDANAARIAADQRVTQVVQAERDKDVLIQQAADRKMVRVQRESEKQIGEANLEADRKANDAVQALWVARDQIRADASTRLDGAEHALGDLRPKLEARLSPADSANLVTNLQTRIAILRQSVADVAQCSADGLDSAKRSIEAGLRNLDRAIDDAKKRS
jgi:hypothetical protein